MFLFMLGGSLALGGGLFVLASFSEGTLVPARTAALVIGWLFVLATIGGVAALRRPGPAAVTAAAVTLCSGLLVLYIAHFEWSEIAKTAPMPSAYAAVELKVIEAPSPALAAALGMKEIVVPELPKMTAHTPLLAAVAKEDSCAAFHGVESLQCRRGCGEKTGLAWVVCQESARLEYCESRPHDDANCPSPIPRSYPG